MEPKLIYISCPYTKGDVAVNVRNSVIASEQVIACGHLPYNPLMSHFHHLISPHNYEYWMELDLKLIYKMDAVIRLAGESSGADRECELARRLSISVLEVQRADKVGYALWQNNFVSPSLGILQRVE